MSLFTVKNGNYYNRVRELTNFLIFDMENNNWVLLFINNT